MRCGVAHGKRLSAALGMLLLAGASGCTYLNNRLSDARQMMDLGFTFSTKPQFGLYANCPMVTPVGYSKVDGYFVGVGGGKLGAGEHHQNNAGALLWGREENSWKGLDKDDKPTVESHKAGVLGIAESAKEGRRAYKPACVHYLHLGFVGIMWNLNYHKMADFFCGWFGYIPFGDRNEAADDTRIAKAPEEAPAAPPATPEAGNARMELTAMPKASRTERSTSPFSLRAPAEPPAAPAPAAAATPKLAPSALRDEIALAVARDVAAAKAELAALRLKAEAQRPKPEAPADPRPSLPLEQLVP